MTFAKPFGLSIGLSAAKTIGLADLFALAKQRRALSHLNDAALADMGLTQGDVAREAKRAAWDVPSTWRN